MEHRDRLAGRGIVVADPGEAADDLLRGMIDVLTSMWARPYRRRGRQIRVVRVLRAAKFEAGEAA